MTFQRDHALYFSLSPRNTGHGQPKAISGIPLDRDKDQMFFVSHWRLEISISPPQLPVRCDYWRYSLIPAVGQSVVDEPLAAPPRVISILSLS